MLQAASVCLKNEDYIPLVVNCGLSFKRLPDYSRTIAEMDFMLLEQAFSPYDKALLEKWMSSLTYHIFLDF